MTDINKLKAQARLKSSKFKNTLDEFNLQIQPKALASHVLKEFDARLPAVSRVSQSLKTNPIAGLLVLTGLFLIAREILQQPNYRRLTLQHYKKEISNGHYNPNN